MQYCFKTVTNIVFLVASFGEDADDDDDEVPAIRELRPCSEQKSLVHQVGCRTEKDVLRSLGENNFKCALVCYDLEQADDHVIKFKWIINFVEVTEGTLLRE